MCLNMRTRDKQTATEIFMCWCFIVEEKNQKILRGGNHPTLYVWGLILITLVKDELAIGFLVIF